MSRHRSEVSLAAWRAALLGLALVSSVTVIAALLVADHGQADNAALIFDRLDERWIIRSGRAEADRLVLSPTAGSIGLALHPIASSAFTLQARITFDPPQGAAGLIVQASDTDHFSAFLISGDGYFRVSDYRNGVWIDRAAWRTWPYIQRGGAANVLRAECQSGTCTFFVNDEWTWQEHALPAMPLIGFVAESSDVSGPFAARFDQIGWRP
jgi:hypothetical protein